MVMRKRVGEYLLDVSKLIFGGAVLSTVLKMESVSKSGILIVGIVTLIAWAGVLIYDHKHRRPTRSRN